MSDFGILAFLKVEYSKKMRQINTKKITDFVCTRFNVWRFFVFFSVFLGLFFWIGFYGWGASVDEVKNDLQQELDQIQEQINQLRPKIQETQTQAKTLKREVELLDSRIKQAELQIRQTELVLRQTQMSINEKTSDISKQEARLEREKILLGQYLESIYESDQQGIVEMIFGQQKLSDIFNELNALDVIQGKTYETISQIRVIKTNLEKEKEELSEKKEEELKLKSLQEIEKAALRKQQSDKKNLLAQTQGQESAFQKLLQKAKADAAAIRSQIYLLEGVGLSMSLGEAFSHAKFATDLTGVRPAFLLAVLKQESSWGTSVGTGNWKRDMHPRDHQAFLQICEELGLDPNKMPVSRKPSYGWGGAMGPAQFLPTTWLAYKDEVARLTGHNPSSPWDIDDSFTAAALKLAKAGASQKTYSAEWKAAMIYFAGSNWSRAVYSFYGDAVMELAGVIQEQLDLIGKN